MPDRVGMGKYSGSRDGRVRSVGEPVERDRVTDDATIIPFPGAEDARAIERLLDLIEEIDLDAWKRTSVVFERVLADAPLVRLCVRAVTGDAGGIVDALPAHLRERAAEMGARIAYLKVAVPPGVGAMVRDALQGRIAEPVIVADPFPAGGEERAAAIRQGYESGRLSFIERAPDMVLTDKGRAVFGLEMKKMPDSRYETVTPLRVAHSDARGKIVNVWQGELSHVAVFDRKKGSVFAEHYHPGLWIEDAWVGNVQRMYTIEGRYLSVSAPLDGEGHLVGEPKVVEVGIGDLTETGPMIAHAYVALDDCVMLNLNSEQRLPGGYGQHTIPLPAGRRLVLDVGNHQRTDGTDCDGAVVAATFKDGDVDIYRCVDCGMTTRRIQ